MVPTTVAKAQKAPMWRFPGVRAIVAGTVQSILGYTFPSAWWAIFLRSMLKELRWSATIAGVGLSIGNTVGFFGSIIGGVAVDRWGPRWMTLLFFGVMGLGFLGAAFMDAEWHYFLLYGVVIYFPYYGGTYRMSYAAVNRWWMDRRVMAIGLVTLGGGMGALSSPLGAVLTEVYGWRAMMLLAAFCLIVICGGVAFLYPSHLPERYGLYVDNRSPEERRALAAARVGRGQAIDTRPPLVDMEIRAILRSRAFWMICIATMISGLVGPFYMFQNVAMGSKGYTLTEAAAWMSMQSMMSYVGRFSVLFFGDWLVNRIPVRLTFAAGYLMNGVGVVIFALGTQPWHFIIWAILFGFGMGFYVPLTGVIIGAYFGRTAFGGTYGIRTALYTITAALAPTACGWLADIQGGDWTLSFLIMSLGSILCGAILIFAYPPPEQPRERRW